MSTTPTVAAELEALVVPIDSLQLHPLNARRGDIPAIMQSLQRFGQMKPIVVHDESGYVVAGNHTLQAAQRLGWDSIAAVRQSMPDDEAQAYLLADNRASDRARYKNSTLLGLLQETLDLEGTGFDIDDVEDLEAELGGDGDDGFGDPADPADPGSAPTSEKTKPEPAKPKAAPMREVVMLMPADQAVQFGLHIAHLQKHYGLSTVVDTVRKAAEDAAVSSGYTADPAEEKPKAKPRAKKRPKARKVVDEKSVAKAAVAAAAKAREAEGAAA